MTKSAKPTSSKQKGKLHKFVGRDRIEEHLSQIGYTPHIATT
jgi:hypothetical protein